MLPGLFYKILGDDRRGLSQREREVVSPQGVPRGRVPSWLYVAAFGFTRHQPS
jgi:hypothetical protein